LSTFFPEISTKLVYPISGKEIKNFCVGSRDRSSYFEFNVPVFSLLSLFSVSGALFQFNAANFLFLLLDDKISSVFAIYRMCLNDWIMALIHAIILKIRSLSLLSSDNSVFPSPLQVQVPSSVRSAKILLPSESTSLIIFLSFYSHFYLYLSC
jgi:hypothetical protein